MNPAQESKSRNTFGTDQIDAALQRMAEVGFCVLRRMIPLSWVDDLKNSIDAALDPNRDLGPSSNRYHMAFAEASPVLWRLATHAPFMDYVEKVHGTSDVCLHRSAAILRTAHEPMGMWHTDHRGMVENPKVANDILNRYPMPSGSWFYLNGSHPDRSGIAVIESSHLPGWKGPEGFRLTRDGTSFNRLDQPEDEGCQDMDVPGCVPVYADPGDLICFAANAFHANMATHERRYSAGLSFRPKSIHIEAPWPLPEAARTMMAELPESVRRFADGYVSYDGSWRG